MVIVDILNRKGIISLFSINTGAHLLGKIDKIYRVYALFYKKPTAVKFVQYYFWVNLEIMLVKMAC
jgi:hypothetical protein